MACDAESAHDADLACIAYEAVRTFLAHEAVPYNEPVIWGLDI